MPEAVLGIDAGTGSLKGGLFGLDGRSFGTARAGYAVLSPQPDAREQDANAWWAALCSVCTELVQRAPANTRVLAVAIAGQAPALVATDADLQPTHSAISWLDPRPSREAERMYARLGQPVPVWGSWPSQAAWFARNQPEAMRTTRWFLGCPDFLTSRLVATATALLPVSEPELEAADLDATFFPPVWTPGTLVGSVSSSASQATCLPAGTPVVGGHVDGLLGVLGSGVQVPGDACINCGTSGTFSVICDPPLGYPMFGVSVAGSATNTSGVALDWFASNILNSPSAYADLLECAAPIPAGCQGLLFLPHLAGERGSTADAHARGAWVGLTLAHDRRHLLRSLLEGVAFSFRAMQDWLEDSGAPVGDVRCVGGQAHSALWNQLKADVLNRRLLVPEVLEAAVVGAAILAAVGIAAYAEPWQAARGMVRIAHQFEPDPARATLYADLFALHRSLYPALRQTNWQLRGYS